MKTKRLNTTALGEMIAARRRAMGLTCEDMRQAVSWASVDDYIDAEGNGMFNVDDLFNICQRLRCDPADLIRLATVEDGAE